MATCSPVSSPSKRRAALFAVRKALPSSAFSRDAAVRPCLRADDGALGLPAILAAEVHFKSRLVAARLIETIKRERISVLAAVPRVMALLKTHLEAQLPNLAERVAASEKLEPSAAGCASATFTASLVSSSGRLSLAAALWRGRSSSSGTAWDSSWSRATSPSSAGLGVLEDRK